MPVQVRVPVRVRLDARSLAETPDRVTEALAVALARALDRSRREAVEPRGGYLGVRTTEPVFTWTGDAVPGAARRAFEDRLRAVVADAVDAARLDPGLPDGVAAPLSEPPAETADPVRESALLRTYELPSYQGGGEPEVIDFSDEPAVVTPVSHEWVVRPVGELRAHLRAAAAEAVRQFGPPPAGTPAGLLAKVVDASGHTVWGAIVFTTPWSFFGFPTFQETTLVAGPNARFQTRDVDPPAGPATAVRRMIADRAALVATAADLLGPDIRALIVHAQPRGATTSQAEYDRRVDTAVDAEINRRVDAVLAGLGGAAPTSVIVLTLGGGSMLLVSTDATDADLHWTGVANLLPVSVERPRGHGHGTGAGGGAGANGGGGTGGGAGTGAGGEGDATGAGGDGTGGGDGDSDGSGGFSIGMGGGAGGGAFVWDPTAPTTPPPPPGKEPSRFPVVRRGLFSREPRGCAPFNGEPSLDELGRAGEGLRRAMEDIAFRLQMGKICDYPANFCLQAAETLFGRAASISAYIGLTERDGFTQPTPDGDGALGSLNFRPVASPAVQFLRHLAGVVPRLHALALAVMRTYEQPENWAKVHGGWIDSTASWDLHFLEEFTPATEAAVGQILVSGSQALLLQLLLSSRTGINARITNFDRYAPIFERLLVSQLTDYAELSRLRERLRRHTAAAWVQGHTGQGGGAVAAASQLHPATAWFGAAHALSGAFLATEQALTTAGTAGEIVTTGGVARIRDSHGVMWSESDLDQAMVMQRGQAEGIDPLVKQITDLPDVIERFRTDPTAIRRELRRLLDEMSANNAEMLDKARADAMFAFRASRISDNIPAATVPGSRYALQGIHLQVHQELGEFFGGDSFYALGIDALFSAELGREELIGFGLTVGIVLLSVLCPPLGFLAGVVVAANDVRHARERERLYGSMLDPELVLTRAEVEVELFAAYLGLALSLLPEVGTIGGAVVRGGRVGLRAGLRSGLRAARGYVARRISRQIVEAASRDLLQAFITEILVNEVLGRIIQKAMEPVLAHIEHEAMLTESVGGPEGARFILMVLAEERRAAAAPAGAVRAPVVRP
ncbi:hypothetical protein [Micromonospora siamensis]|uniref:Uncharacterized protein n=1 Tax=Micromonospora siamensis TaxID=299152 RepID=A0A1C5J1P6_9ACTN|nr:hypothetical protein [Micromonospora siamensis]SCG64527.1 hypothetical protein GA0074704_4034 [Micromonospora siamensis]